VCKYGLLYFVASAIAVLRVQLRFVDCINKRKKKKEEDMFPTPANKSHKKKNVTGLSLRPCI